MSYVWNQEFFKGWTLILDQNSRAIVFFAKFQMRKDIQNTAVALSRTIH